MTEIISESNATGATDNPAGQTTTAKPGGGKPRNIFGPDSAVWFALFAIVFGLLAFYFYRGINLPWVENDNYYGAIYAQAAHNNLRAGLKTTGGIPATLYFGRLPIPVEDYYVHHPTLLPLLTTASFAMFGESEWATRLVPIVCSMLSMVFLWLFVGNVVNRRAAFFAAAVMATLPMVLHYGDMVDFEPCLVMLMLAALVCLRYWHTRGKLWGWLSAICCLLAVWMDWPGYLFVISVMAYYFFKGTKTQRLFALGLLAICAFSGMAFLIQIQHVNPDAWSDLWTALNMRLGNGVATGSSAAEMRNVHFTFAQWVDTVIKGMKGDYSLQSLNPGSGATPLIGAIADFLTHKLHFGSGLASGISNTIAFFMQPLLLAGMGIVITLFTFRKSEGMRWAGLGTLHMAVAGVLYVVILRNESYIHDFTTFYLIAAVAIMGGICLEGIYKWLEGRRTPWPLSLLIIFIPIVWMGFSGYMQAQTMRSQFGMLDGVIAEPENLIPDMGKKLAEIFPQNTIILCNFDPYASVLPYYTQRTILNNLTTYDDWKGSMSQEEGPYGGIIWLDAPQASEIMMSLPKEEVTAFDLDGFHFAVWKPAK